MTAEQAKKQHDNSSTSVKVAIDQLKPYFMFLACVTSV